MKRNLFLGVMTVLAIAGCGTTGVDSIPEGNPPVIEAILAEDTDVRVGAGIRLKADVQSDAGQLTYTWQASHGIVSKPYETALMWIAPYSVPSSPYVVTIQLTVKDKFGRSAKDSTQIRVYNQ